MKDKYIIAQRIPRVTKEFALAIQKVFPKRPISPGDTIESIMWEAGRQEVVEYILRQAKQVEDESPVESTTESKPVVQSSLRVWLGRLWN